MASFELTRKSALALIKSSGQLLTFTRAGSPVHDPIEGSVSVEPTTFQAQVLVLPYNDKQRQDFDEGVTEGLVSSRTRFLLVAANGTRLQADDMLNYEEANNWRVLGVNVLSFQGVDILYKAVVTR